MDNKENKKEFKELLKKLDNEVKKSKHNKKFEDTIIIPVGDKHCLLLFDTTEVRVSKNAIEDGRILFFTKVNAMKNEENNEFNTKKNKANEDTDYVAFEIMPLLKKRLLENKKLQEKFMSYVALYFLNTKRENRDRKNHFIGFWVKQMMNILFKVLEKKMENILKRI